MAILFQDVSDRVKRLSKIVRRGGRYFFTENFAAGAEYRTGDELGGADLDVIYVGVRYAF